MLGIIKPDKGDVFIFGEHVKKLNNKKMQSHLKNDISYMLQTNDLILNETIIYNIKLPLKNKHISTKDIMIKLKEFNINALPSTPVYKLSIGQQKRISLIKQIFKNPKVIILDEPTANLDYDNAHIVYNTLYKLNKNQSITIIIVTHDKEIFNYTNNIKYLN